MPFLAEREFDYALARQIIWSEQSSFIVNGLVVDLEATISDEPPCFSIRGDQSGTHRRVKNTDVTVEIVNLDGWQCCRNRAFLKSLARGGGGFFGSREAVHERGCLGGEHFLSLVNFLTLQRAEAGDLVEG